MALSHANHLHTLTRKLYGLSGMVTSKAHTAIAEELIAEGERLVNLAGDEGSYRNRTGNLRTSIGSCLYVDGREWNPNPGAKSEYSRRYYDKIKNPYQSDAIGSELNKPKKDPETGEEIFGVWALNRFFDEYKAPKGKWQLIVVAAMFYAGCVETKGYKVISFIETAMSSSSVASKYKATIKNVPNRWNG